MNEDDKAFNSRYLLLQFSALQANDDADPQLYPRWLMIRELLSALTPDFSSLLYNDRLDSEAIQDCAAFLQAAIGRKRDRNANMWGILLYFMLLLNMMFQSTCREQLNVFEWIVKTVARSSYELTNHASVLDQFVLAIHKIQTTRANPLGREHETLYLHNMRTNCSPHASIFNGPASTRWYAFRLEAVCAVIQNTIGRSFSAVELGRMVEESTWAMRGKAPFYDIKTNSWPIAQTVHDDATNTNTLVPLAEDDLLVGHVKEMRCVFMKQSKFDEIVQSVECGSQPDACYKTVEITSSNEEAGQYNFYRTVTLSNWFGYRALAHSTFSVYCGAQNEMHVVEEVEVLHDVCDANDDAGFPSVEKLYQPEWLLKYYGYSFPDMDKLPIGYKMNPFVMRNGEEDEPLDSRFPPWYDTYYKKGSAPGYGEIFDKGTISYDEWHFRPGATGAREAEQDFSQRAGSSPPPQRGPAVDDAPRQSPPSGTQISPRKPTRHREDDEQSSVQCGPTMNRRDPGSSLDADTLLGAEDSPSGPHAGGGRAAKRVKRSMQFVSDEAEDEDGDIEQVQHPNAQLPQKRGKAYPNPPFYSSQDGEESDLDGSFIDDSYQAQGRHVPGKCQTVIFIEDDGTEITCGNDCNPRVQSCYSCRSMF